MDSTAIFDAVRSVTGAWARQRKAEEREASRLSRRRDALVRSRRMTVREAAWRVMPQAYLKASSNGTLPAHARQIMYAARGEIQRLAGRTLDDQYFTQQLLPDFMNEHPSATAEWDVVFDARGHFHEPHTGRIVPLGTIEVRRHLREVAGHTLPELQVALPEMAVFPTCGPEPPLRRDPVRREGGLPAPLPGRAARRALRSRDHVDQGAVGHGKPAPGRPAVRGARGAAARPARLRQVRVQHPRDAPARYQALRVPQPDRGRRPGAPAGGRRGQRARDGGCRP